MSRLLQQQRQQLTQELTIPQILRFYGKQFRQVKKLYSDEPDGRCAIGVIMEYYGWDGKHNSNMTKSLQATHHALKKANISDNIIIELNDSGVTFDEIADFLDRYQNWLASKHNVPGGI
jgi:hypothetical protein